jgi:hypothetical protein
MSADVARLKLALDLYDYWQRVHDESKVLHRLKRFALMTKTSNPGNTWIDCPPTNPNDPPRNIRLYLTRYAAG